MRELDRVCFREGSKELSGVAQDLYDARSDVWRGAVIWRDVHRLVLQLVAAEIVSIEMKKSVLRPDGSFSYSTHLAWADAALPPGSAAPQRTRSRNRQHESKHEVEGAWAGIYSLATATAGSWPPLLLLL